MTEATPAIEIRHADGTVQRIWSDGRIEGFAGKPVIFNRIPAQINAAVARERDRQGKLSSKAIRGVFDKRKKPQPLIGGQYKSGVEWAETEYREWREATLRELQAAADAAMSETVA